MKNWLTVDTNIAIFNEGSLSGVIMLLLCYFFGYIIVIFPFLDKFLTFAYYITYGILQVVSKLFLQKDL